MTELFVGQGRASRLIAESEALQSPFVLVDIGARDGIHKRWKPLNAVLDVYGYDASALVESPNPRHRYFKLALGERDCETRIEIPAGNGYEARVSATGSIAVQMFKLDTLHARGDLPEADFVKIDCEGYEPQILEGAQDFLAASGLLGADVETTFNTSPTLPNSHFVEIFKALNRHGLFVGDFAFASAIGASQLPWPGTCNVLFTRKFESPADPDRVLKMIAICDLYGMYAQALTLIREYRIQIDGRISSDLLERAIRLSIEELEPRLERYLPRLNLGIWSTIRSRQKR